MRILVPLAFISFLIGCSVSGGGPGSGGSTDTGLGPYAQSADGPSASPATGPTALGSDGPSASPTTQIAITETDLYEKKDGKDYGSSDCISYYINLFSDLYNEYKAMGTHIIPGCNEMKIMDGNDEIFKAILHKNKCEIDIHYDIGPITERITKTITNCTPVKEE
jgi:hypothetical protein